MDVFQQSSRSIFQTLSSDKTGISNPTSDDDSGCALDATEYTWMSRSSPAFSPLSNRQCIPFDPTPSNPHGLYYDGDSYFNNTDEILEHLPPSSEPDDNYNSCYNDTSELNCTDEYFGSNSPDLIWPDIKEFVCWNCKSLIKNERYTMNDGWPTCTSCCLNSPITNSKICPMRTSTHKPPIAVTSAKIIDQSPNTISKIVDQSPENGQSIGKTSDQQRIFCRACGNLISGESFVIRHSNVYCSSLCFTGQNYLPADVSDTRRTPHDWKYPPDINSRDASNRLQTGKRLDEVDFSNLHGDYHLFDKRYSTPGQVLRRNRIASGDYDNLHSNFRVYLQNPTFGKPEKTNHYEEIRDVIDARMSTSVTRSATFTQTGLHDHGENPVRRDLNSQGSPCSDSPSDNKLKSSKLVICPTDYMLHPEDFCKDNVKAESLKSPDTSAKDNSTPSSERNVKLEVDDLADIDRISRLEIQHFEVEPSRRNNVTSNGVQKLRRGVSIVEGSTPKRHPTSRRQKCQSETEEDARVDPFRSRACGNRRERVGLGMVSMPDVANSDTDAAGISRRRGTRVRYEDGLQSRLSRTGTDLCSELDGCHRTVAQIEATPRNQRCTRRNWPSSEGDRMPCGLAKQPHTKHRSMSEIDGVARLTELDYCRQFSNMDDCSSSCSSCSSSDSEFDYYLEEDKNTGRFPHERFSFPNYNQLHGKPVEKSSRKQGSKSKRKRNKKCIIS